jgi:hypothetical protein
MRATWTTCPGAPPWRFCLRSARETARNILTINNFSVTAWQGWEIIHRRAAVHFLATYATLDGNDCRSSYVTVVS